jgi:hypothetical protein
MECRIVEEEDIKERKEPEQGTEKQNERKWKFHVCV